MWMGIVQSFVGLNETKRGRRENSLLPPDRQTWVSCPRRSWLSRLWMWTGICVIDSTGPQASGLRLSHASCSPGSPACRRQIVGPLSLQDHVHQFLKINLILSPLSILYLISRYSISLGNPDYCSGHSGLNSVPRNSRLPGTSHL